MFIVYNISLAIELCKLKEKCYCRTLLLKGTVECIKGMTDEGKFIPLSLKAVLKRDVTYEKEEKF